MKHFVVYGPGLNVTVQDENKDAAKEQVAKNWRMEKSELVAKEYDGSSKALEQLLAKLKRQGKI